MSEVAVFEIKQPNKKKTDEPSKRHTMHGHWVGETNHRNIQTKKKTPKHPTFETTYVTTNIE